MVGRIRGESGRRRVDRVVKMAISELVFLLMYQCFVWLVELGGSVMDEE